MNKIYVIFFLLFEVIQSLIVLQAQENYPQHYFRNPLSIPIQLAANFGELRSDHFHMGLDIRTQGRENLPVFAAADGYVSRIKIEKLGYGKAIYITHPNGYTTVYAHLNSFYKELDDYIKSKQYNEESWEQDFELPANLFKVSKSQFIAYSGNTGGSAGPHLHFEIRDAKTGNNLNPLLFGFDVKDNLSPIIYTLFWYDRKYSIYTAQPQLIPIIKKNNSYNSIAKIVKVGSPQITLGLRMEDLNNASPFKYGVYKASLLMDDSLLFEFKLNDFIYDDSRYVNASMDYKRWTLNNQGIQYLSKLPGNHLNIFSKTNSDGKIILNDTLAHSMQIVLSDENNNKTTLNFLLKYDSSLQKNYSLPTDAFVCDVNEKNNINTENASVHFDANAFYDALLLSVFETPATSFKQVSSTIHIGNYSIPVHDSFTVSIKTNITSEALKNKVVMQMQSGNSSGIIKGTWQQNVMTGRFDELGNVGLLVDTIAPIIVPVAWKNNATFINQKTLTMMCKDDVGKLKSLRAELDGNWLMFARNSDYFIYTFDEHCAKGNHLLKITATDIAGNVAEQTYNFTKQ